MGTTITALALALVLITGTGASAAPVYLACSGMSQKRAIAGPNQETQDVISIIVDIDDQTLTVNGYPIPIAKITESAIVGIGPRSFDIDIDRISGKVSLSAPYYGMPPVNWSFDGICMLTQRLF